MSKTKSITKENALKSCMGAIMPKIGQDIEMQGIRQEKL